MTQEQVQILFEIAVAIHTDEWFGKRKNMRDTNQVKEWVSHKLANTMQIHTIPINDRWGMLVTKERFKQYWKTNGTINR
jgi:hypothetical protein